MAERVETRDVTPRLAALLAALAVAMLAACALIVLLIAPQSLHIPKIDLPPAPEPTLQLSPRADMERFQAEQMAELESYGWVDREHGIGRIPIGKAMEKVVQDGIPGWPREAK